MEAYINGIGMVSPQGIYNRQQFERELILPVDGRFQVSDPGYKNYIDPKLSRRMSKVIKMGVSAAKICMEDAGITMPGSILVGTGLGCMEDTEAFLSEIIRNKEQLLTPTAFIQSTHNTVAAQVALMIKCHEVNFTYVHNGFSFELALQDAMMQLAEGTNNILVGGVDELTADTFHILKRFGLLKVPGKVFGEGAAFFMLENKKNANSYAKLLHVETLLKPESQAECSQLISRSLSHTGLDAKEIDLFVAGFHDQESQECSNWRIGPLSAAGRIEFKQFCGDYHTASSFGFGLAASILRHQRIPVPVIEAPFRKEIRNVLFYNRFQGHHAVYLLEAC
jgi:3-oxoacyl-[acyl-carrier-protein] synthase II